MATSMPTCDCCERAVPAGDWDYLYGMCGDCAWCHSLHEPNKGESLLCHHGECRKDATL